MRPADLEQRIAAAAGWLREAEANEARHLALGQDARATHWRALARAYARRLEILRAELAAVRAKPRTTRS